MKITLLASNLPPIVCGVADHSKLLGKAMIRQGCEVGLLGLRGDSALVHKAGFPGAASIWDGTTNGLIRFIKNEKPDWLWVQLSSYGYSRLGAPWLLGRSLRALKNAYPCLKLAVCVHETYCKPHQLGHKGFWLSPWQKYTSKVIVRMGDLVLPTIAEWEYVCIKELMVDRGVVKLLPIAANMPPLKAVSEQRAAWRADLGLKPEQRVAVIFGTWASQQKVFRRFRKILKESFKNGNVDHILAVGGDDANWPSWAKDMTKCDTWKNRLTLLGPQSENRVSEILSIADIGLVPTPFGFWEKSGAARAFEQARLDLWIIEDGNLRQIAPNPDPPTWDGLAKLAINWLNDFGSTGHEFI